MYSWNVCTPISVKWNKLLDYTMSFSVCNAAASKRTSSGIFAAGPRFTENLHQFYHDKQPCKVLSYWATCFLCWQDCTSFDSTLVVQSGQWITRTKKCASCIFHCHLSWQKVLSSFFKSQFEALTTEQTLVYLCFGPPFTCLLGRPLPLHNQCC